MNATGPMITHDQNGISPQEAQNLLSQGKAELIDIRETEEYAGLRIPGATLAPLSIFKLLPPPQHPEQTAVYFCRSGRRTSANAELLTRAGYQNTRFIDGGLNAWKAAGLPVQTSKTGLPIMQQVLLIAGLLILTFTTLALNFPWAAAGLFLVGTGLTYAGASGNCLMRTLLQKMPWNKE